MQCPWACKVTCTGHNRPPHRSVQRLVKALQQADDGGLAVPALAHLAGGVRSGGEELVGSAAMQSLLDARTRAATDQVLDVAA